jgi:hypothetical protein
MQCCRKSQRQNLTAASTPDSGPYASSADLDQGLTLGILSQARADPDTIHGGKRNRTAAGWPKHRRALAVVRGPAVRGATKGGSICIGTGPLNFGHPAAVRARSSTLDLNKNPCPCPCRPPCGCSSHHEHDPASRQLCASCGGGLPRHHHVQLQHHQVDHHQTTPWNKSDPPPGLPETISTDIVLAKSLKLQALPGPWF